MVTFSFVLVLCGSAVAAGEQNSSAPQKNVALNSSSNQTSSYYEGTPNIRGYWINRAKTEYNTIDVSAVKKAGITDLFIATPKNDVEGTLKPYLNKFSGSGIKIHAWVTCFTDSNGKWYDPGKNKGQVDKLTSNITSISTKYNVHGIHLDYVRYPGTAYKFNGTTHVTSFVKNIYNKIQKINNQKTPGKHRISLSATFMPERGSNGYYYGQDYGQMAPYLDFLVPMIYKGNYGAGSSWVGSVTKYIVENSGRKPVLAGLQTYRSDDNPIPIPACELDTDIKAALENGASGYVLFKYGLTDTSISGIPYYSNTDIAKILVASASVKNYIEKYEKPPSTVSVGTTKVDMPTFLYLSSKSLVNVNNKNTGPIRVIEYNNPTKPIETVKSGSIPKSEYLKIASKVQSYLKTYGRAPNYASSSLGNIPYKNLIYTFSNIMNFYKVNKALPSSIYIKTLSWPRVTSTNPVSNAAKVSRSSPITITFDDKIKAGANYSKIYVKNLATGKKVVITKTIENNTLTIKTSTKSFKTSYQVYLPDGAVKNTIGSSLVKSYTYKFTTLPESYKFTTLPELVSVVKTSPINKAVNVPVNKVFTVTFSKNIKAGNSWIELVNSKGKAVSFTKSIKGKVLTIKPKKKLAESKYKLILHTGSVTDQTGNKLTLKSFIFSVGKPPKVTKTSPTNKAVNVPVNKVFKMTFNENIKTGNSWIELVNSKGKAVSFTKSIKGKVLTIKPKKKLAESKYKLILHTGSIIDHAGNPLKLKSFIFSVGSPPKITKTKPSKNANKISRTAPITITFNKNIKAGTNYSKIYIKNLTTGKKVSIIKTVKGKILTLKMKFNRLSRNMYQVYLPAKVVKDVHGNNPVSSYTFKFKTV